MRFFNQLRDQISLSLENFPVLLIFGVNGSLFSVVFLLSLDQVYCILDICDHPQDSSHFGDDTRTTRSHGKTKDTGVITERPC